MRKMLLGLIISLILFSTAPAARALADFDWEFDQHIHVVDILDDGKTVNEVSDSWINLWGDFDLRTVSSKWTNICWLIQEQDAQNICIRDLNFDGNLEINQILRNSSGTYVWFKWGQHPWQGIIRKGDRLKIQFNYETFSLSTKLGDAWKTLISKGIASMTTYGLTGGSCKNVRFSFLLPKYAKMVTANSEGLTPSFSSLDKRVVVEFSFSNGTPKDHAPYEVAYTYAKPVLTARLDLTPIPAVYYEGDALTYYVGDALTARFSVKNVGSLPITLDVLTVGGRLNGECPPEGCPDFTFRTVTLQPGEPPTQYEGSLTLTRSGEYHFFVAYYIEDPTPEEKLLLDENNWNTCIDLGEGLTDADRTEDLLAQEIPSAKVYIPSQIKVLMTDGSVEPMSLEEYVKGVVAVEMSSGWPIEALKAQAVAARTIAVKNTQHDHTTIDVCTDPGDCQAWSPPPYSESIENAVASTRSEVILFNGKIISQALYFGHCIGQTRNSEERFPDYYAYLRGVPCNGELCNTPSSSSLHDGCRAKHDGKGYYGHGVGMCQRGAKSMADQGSSYLDILKYYYSGVEIVPAITAEQRIVAKLGSPAELRVYDAEDRVTGVVDGVTKEEIPNSNYDEVREEVTIFLPTDFYYYEIRGSDKGIYGLEISFIDGAQITAFNATNIPTSLGSIHQYVTYWDALSAGEKGVIVRVDSNGDGIFEYALLSDMELANDEYLADMHWATDLNNDGTVNILDIFIMANVFGSKRGDKNWDELADLNADGVVNILDIFAVAWDFGKTV